VDLDTGLTPFFLLYGRDARLPDSFMEPVQAIEASDAEGLNTDVYVEGLLRRMLMARLRVLEAQARRGLAYSEHNSKLRRHEYVVGDQVLVYRPKTGKLEPRYEGPYSIIEDINGGGVTFRVSRRDRNGKLAKRTLHASMFKPFIIRHGWMENDKPEELQLSGEPDGPSEADPKATEVVLDEDEDLEGKQETTEPGAAAIVVDQAFLSWLEARQLKAGAVKSDLIAVLDSGELDGALYYKLDFRGWRATGWVPQYIVLQYWDETRLDSWAAAQRLRVQQDSSSVHRNETKMAGTCVRQGGSRRPRTADKARAPGGLASFPVGTRVASYIYTAATGLREWYAGRVVGYDVRKKWYRIRYDDGDGAELTKTEVVKGQKDYMLHFVANGVAREEQ
jgi:hypothetical protein